MAGRSTPNQLPLLQLIEEAEQEARWHAADERYRRLQFEWLGGTLMQAGWTLEEEEPPLHGFYCRHRPTGLTTTRHRTREEAVREAYLESVLEEWLPERLLADYYREHDNLAPVTPRIRMERLRCALRRGAEP